MPEPFPFSDQIIPTNDPFPFMDQIDDEDRDPFPFADQIEENAAAAAAAEDPVPADLEQRAAAKDGGVPRSKLLEELNMEQILPPLKKAKTSSEAIPFTPSEAQEGMIRAVGARIFTDILETTKIGPTMNAKERGGLLAYTQNQARTMIAPLTTDEQGALVRHAASSLTQDLLHKITVRYNQLSAIPDDKLTRKERRELAAAQQTLEKIQAWQTRVENGNEDTYVTVGKVLTFGWGTEHTGNTAIDKLDDAAQESLYKRNKHRSHNELDYDFLLDAIGDYATTTIRDPVSNDIVEHVTAPSYIRKHFRNGLDRVRLSRMGVPEEDLDKTSLASVVMHHHPEPMLRWMQRAQLLNAQPDVKKQRQIENQIMRTLHTDISPETLRAYDVFSNTTNVRQLPRSLLTSESFQADIAGIAPVRDVQEATLNAIHRLGTEALQYMFGTSMRPVDSFLQERTNLEHGTTKLLQLAKKVRDEQLTLGETSEAASLRTVIDKHTQFGDAGLSAQVAVTVAPWLTHATMVNFLQELGGTLPEDATPEEVAALSQQVRAKDPITKDFLPALKEDAFKARERSIARVTRGDAPINLKFVQDVGAQALLSVFTPIQTYAEMVSKVDPNLSQSIKADLALAYVGNAVAEKAMRPFIRFTQNSAQALRTTRGLSDLAVTSPTTANKVIDHLRANAAAASGRRAEKLMAAHDAFVEVRRKAVTNIANVQKDLSSGALNDARYQLERRLTALGTKDLDSLLASDAVAADVRDLISEGPNRATDAMRRWASKLSKLGSKRQGPTYLKSFGADLDSGLQKINDVLTRGGNLADIKTQLDEIPIPLTGIPQTPSLRAKLAERLGLSRDALEVASAVQDFARWGADRSAITADIITQRSKQRVTQLDLINHARQKLHDRANRIRTDLIDAEDQVTATQLLDTADAIDVQAAQLRSAVDSLEGRPLLDAVEITDLPLDALDEFDLDLFMRDVAHDPDLFLTRIASDPAQHQELVAKWRTALEEGGENVPGFQKLRHDILAELGNMAGPDDLTKADIELIQRLGINDRARKQLDQLNSIDALGRPNIYRAMADSSQSAAKAIAEMGADLQFVDKLRREYATMDPKLRQELNAAMIKANLGDSGPLDKLVADNPEVFSASSAVMENRAFQEKLLVMFAENDVIDDPAFKEFVSREFAARVWEARERLRILRTQDDSLKLADNLLEPAGAVDEEFKVQRQFNMHTVHVNDGARLRREVFRTKEQAIDFVERNYGIKDVKPTEAGDLKARTALGDPVTISRPVDPENLKVDNFLEPTEAGIIRLNNMVRKAYWNQLASSLDAPGRAFTPDQFEVLKKTKTAKWINENMTSKPLPDKGFGSLGGKHIHVSTLAQIGHYAKSFDMNLKAADAIKTAWRRTDFGMFGEWPSHLLHALYGPNKVSKEWKTLNTKNRILRNPKVHSGNIMGDMLGFGLAAPKGFRAMMDPVVNKQAFDILYRGRLTPELADELIRNRIITEDVFGNTLSLGTENPAINTVLGSPERAHSVLKQPFEVPERVTKLTTRSDQIDNLLETDPTLRPKTRERLIEERDRIDLLLEKEFPNYVGTMPAKFVDVTKKIVGLGKKRLGGRDLSTELYGKAGAMAKLKAYLYYRKTMAPKQAARIANRYFQDYGHVPGTIKRMGQSFLGSMVPSFKWEATRIFLNQLNSNPSGLAASFFGRLAANYGALVAMGTDPEQIAEHLSARGENNVLQTFASGLFVPMGDGKLEWFGMPEVHPVQALRPAFNEPFQEAIGRMFPGSSIANQTISTAANYFGEFLTGGPIAGLVTKLFAGQDSFGRRYDGWRSRFEDVGKEILASITHPLTPGFGHVAQQFTGRNTRSPTAGVPFQETPEQTLMRTFLGIRNVGSGELFDWASDVAKANETLVPLLGELMTLGNFRDDRQRLPAQPLLNEARRLRNDLKFTQADLITSSVFESYRATGESMDGRTIKKADKLERKAADFLALEDAAKERGDEEAMFWARGMFNDTMRDLRQERKSIMDMTTGERFELEKREPTRRDLREALRMQRRFDPMATFSKAPVHVAAQALIRSIQKGVDKAAIEEMVMMTGLNESQTDIRSASTEDATRALQTLSTELQAMGLAWDGEQYIATDLTPPDVATHAGGMTLLHWWLVSALQTAQAADEVDLWSTEQGRAYMEQN